MAKNDAAGDVPTSGELLIRAIRARDLGRVRELIAGGGEIVHEIPEEDAPLGVAVDDGDASIVAALVAAGADANIGGLTSVPLVQAVRRGDEGIIRQLLDAGADVDRAEEGGVTALLVAAMRRRPALVKLLLEAGANPAAMDERDRSARSLAGDNADILKLLDAAPAMPSKPTAAAKSAVSVKAMKYANAAKPKRDAVPPPAAASFFDAVSSGDVETVKKFLSAGIDPNAADEQARTPLYLAVSRQRPGVVALLLNAKADCNRPIGADDGADAQYGGLAMPCPKCGKAFIALVRMRRCPHCGHAFKTADAYNQGPREDREIIFTWTNDWTPLMTAARLNDVPVATMLLDAGAKINRGRGDATPLMCACSFGHVEMVKFLIGRGADVNAVCTDNGEDDDAKLTAADIAGRVGNVELLELLWTAGAKTKDPDAARLAGAARAGDVARVKSLLKFGTKPGTPDPFTGHTPSTTPRARAAPPSSPRCSVRARPSSRLDGASSRPCSPRARRSAKDSDAPRRASATCRGTSRPSSSCSRAAPRHTCRSSARRR